MFDLLSDEYFSECKEWLADQIQGITDSLHLRLPSEWSEQNRYVTVGPYKGLYNFELTPYWREPLDCLGPQSPIEIVDIMKGSQVGATTVLENFVLYVIAELKIHGLLSITADENLARLRLEENILTAINASGLGHLLQSTDEGNSRKTGNTLKKLSWAGGGFLLPFGATNINKLSSVSLPYVVLDELDKHKDNKGGSSLSQGESRAKAYEDGNGRKILKISTPLFKGESQIDAEFRKGDQRYINLPCRNCGKHQVLEFYAKNKTGDKYGLVWKYRRDGSLDEDSVRYLCQFCAYPHRNEDKVWMFPKHEWIPTATPISKNRRSYHVSAMYSPIGMHSWTGIVLNWLSAYDPENNQVRDVSKLQHFENEERGVPFENRQAGVRFESVSAHRRREYRFGEVPNKFSQKVTGSSIHLITLAVDVQDDNLAVAVMGWANGKRPFLIDYWRYEGDCTTKDSEPWKKLQELIEEKEYIADDGKKYGIAITLIDSGDGDNTDVVYSFCEEYESGVYPLKGRDMPTKNAKVKEFQDFTNKLGTKAYHVVVDLYKTRWATALKRDWNGVSEQPYGHFNAPLDITDMQLKELTAEKKRLKIDKATGRKLGYEWYRPSGSRNELWDLLIYNSAALEIVAYDLCCEHYGMKAVDWRAFWELCEIDQMYFSES